MKPNAYAMIALLAVLVAVGCENMGLYDAGPADEARQSPPSALVSEVIQPAPEEDGGELIVDGRRWIAWGRPMALGPQDVRPIGSANGRTVHARAWDRPPYDELFTLTDDAQRWVAYRPVLGGDVPAGTTRPSTGEGAETDHDADQDTGAGSSADEH